jgi:hypothetical protein
VELSEAAAQFKQAAASFEEYHPLSSCLKISTTNGKIKKHATSDAELRVKQGGSI